MNLSVAGFKENTEQIKRINSTIREFGDKYAYVLGVAHAISGESFKEISDVLLSIKNLKDMGKIPKPRKAQVMYLIYKGNLEAAKKICTELAGHKLYDEGSQYDVTLLQLEKKASFSEEIVIDNEVYLYNPNTGEIAKKEDANQFRDNSQDLINKLLAEEEEKRKEAARLEEEASLKLAQELQAQWHNEEEEKKRPEEVQKIMCDICFDEIDVEEYLPLENCGHMFHPDWVCEYFKLQIDESKFPILCPSGNWKIEVNMLDIKERLDEDYLEKFEEFTFNNYVQKNMKDMFCCPTANCQYVFNWARIDTHFICPVCSEQYCIACRAEYHQGMTCEEYKATKDPEELSKLFAAHAESNKLKRCPNCKFWVEKSEGCDHMTCRCGFEFCYLCGGVYRQWECMGYGNPPPRPGPVQQYLPPPGGSRHFDRRRGPIAQQMKRKGPHKRLRR